MDEVGTVLVLQKYIITLNYYYFQLSLIYSCYCNVSNYESR